jgi:hypothetical protein
VSGWDTTNWFKDCLGQKDGTVVTTMNAPLKSATTTPLIYTAQFTGIGAGYYVICSTVNNSCVQFTKEPGKVANGFDFPGKPTMSEAQMQALLGKTASDSISCESQGGPLSWIMCPIIEGLSKAIDGIYDHMIKPLLITKPLDLTANDPTNTYRIWSNFRIFGDIFLVIALLVVVFGESIGGGLIDAYSAKKILPRLLVAAIAINLSIYVVALAVDITNILGDGIASLLLQPFSSVPKGLSLQLGWASSGIGLAALAGGAIWAGALGGALLEFVFVFMLVPGFLLFLAIMATVLLRRALIIILVIVAPVAFALYCLPNTEKYFKQWWELMVKTLLIYPLIAILFAAAKILAVTISTGTRGQGPTAAFAQLMSIIALFVPLFLIPFSFKIAGGIIGRFHDVLNGAGKRAHEYYKGNQNDPWSRRNKARYGLQDRQTQLRERGVNWGMGGTGRRGIGRRAVGRALNYGNLQAQRSRFNRERSEVLEGQIATGDDTNIRDLFIAYDANGVTGYDKDGNAIRGGWFRRMDMEADANGELRAVAGASAVYKDRAAGQMAHNKSLSLYGGDKSSVQSALYYEWKKTGFDESQIGRIRNQYSDVLQDVHLNDNEGGEMAVALGFRHAPNSLSSKYTRYNSETQKWKTDDLGLVKEFSRMVDTYGASKQDVDTFNVLGEGYGRMQTALANDTVDSGGMFTTGYYQGRAKADVVKAKDNIERMADSLNPDQRPAMGGTRVVNQPEEGEAQLSGYGGVSNAPVEVQEAARNFYKTVRGGTNGNQQMPGQGNLF